MRTLETRQSLFGPVSVCQDDLVRWMSIGDQVQGRMFHVPASLAVDSQSRPGPGPVSGSVVTLGWLLAGSQHPQGKVLMLGLGAGAGVCALLHNFPKMSMTVVEIDAEVVRLALKHFPLIERYASSGRLNIVTADAAQTLPSEDAPYDFAAVDIFDGSERFPLAGSGLFKRLGSLAGEVWVNFIGRAVGAEFESLSRSMQQGGFGPACMVSPHPYNMMHLYDEQGTRNWVLASRWPDVQQGLRFIPFTGLTQSPMILDVVRGTYLNALRMLRSPKDVLASRNAGPAGFASIGPFGPLETPPSQP